MRYRMLDLEVGQQVLVRYWGTGEIVDLDNEPDGAVYVRVDGNGDTVAVPVQQVEAVIG